MSETTFKSAPPNHLHDKDCRWYPAHKTGRLFPEWVNAHWVCSAACVQAQEGEKK